MVTIECDYDEPTERFLSVLRPLKRYGFRRALNEPYFAYIGRLHPIIPPPPGCPPPPECPGGPVNVP